MTKVAIVLSGCGFLDGSEIYESVATFLALDKRNIAYQCFAPNIPQTCVKDYITGDEMAERRNVLIESARLARGEIKDLAIADASEFDAIIFPGGFGAASNLSDFALKGATATVLPNVIQFAKAFVKQNKPLGFICIAPTLIPAICGEGVTLTIGNDKATADTLETMGARHQSCDARNIVYDPKHNVVTTPAYMLGHRISEVYEGIDKLVEQVLAIAK